jgi:hypothetical protein
VQGRELRRGCVPRERFGVARSAAVAGKGRGLRRHSGATWGVRPAGSADTGRRRCWDGPSVGQKLLTGGRLTEGKGGGGRTGAAAGSEGVGRVGGNEAWVGVGWREHGFL